MILGACSDGPLCMHLFIMAYRYNQKGVRVGYRHNWTYRGRWNETKTSPGTWKFTFKATKRTKARKGGPKKGFNVRWKINGYQTAVKTGKGTYQTTFRGNKRLVSSRTRRRRY